jgi:hypothetical protein
MENKFCNQDVINEVADEIDVPKFLIKKIESHWHKFAHTVVTSGNFENVLIPYLVKIEFNKRKMDAINYHKAKQESYKK